MFGKRDQLDRKRFDLDRTSRRLDQFEPFPSLMLGKVTSATQLGNANQYRWTYTVAEAWMSGTAVVARPNGISVTAYSVSEMSNNPTVAYGTTIANLPGGFLPVRIPTDTVVILSAHRRENGSLVWLIINTQAIDGTCDP